MLLTPKNQAQGHQNLCPNCQVSDITFRYNRFITGGQVFQIANGKNGNGAYAKAGSNYSIHDNVAENIAYRGCYGCTNQYNQMSTGIDAPLANTLNNVSITHNTFVVGTAVENNPMLNAGFLGIGGPRSRLQPNMTISDNILLADITVLGRLEKLPTAPTTVRGHRTSSRKLEQLEFVEMLSRTGWTSIRHTTGPLATTNFLATNLNRLCQSGNSMGGDYTLAPSSPYKGKASDGTDPGADMATFNEMTDGV